MSSSRRLWYLWDPLRLWSYLHWLESIREHLDQRYVALLSKSMIFVVSILVFDYLVFHCDRFRKPRIDFYAPYKNQGMGTKWFGVPNNNSTTLLDYRYQFMGSLHVVDGRSWTQVSFYYYLHRVLECYWFFIVGCWINFRIGFWGSQCFYGS